MRKIKLTDICNPKQWKTISTGQLLNEGYPVYGANGVIGFFSGFNHENPVVAITCRGASCGSINITIPRSYVTGNAMCLDDVRQDIDTDYLYYNLLYYDFNKVISGSAQPQITRQDLQKVEIPICGLDMQKEMANVLKKTENIIRDRKKELHQLDDLVKARFVEMFENSNYPSCPIYELIDSKVSSAKKVFGKDDIIKYIDISSIDNERNIMTGFTEFIFSKAPSRAQQHISKDDIVISTVRPNLRNVAVNKYDYDNVVASSGFCVLRANTKKCLPSYLMSIVCSDDFTDAMARLVTGANYPAIKDSDVLNYIVKKPPIKLQEEFDLFVKQVDKSKFVYLIIQKTCQT